MGWIFACPKEHIGVKGKQVQMTMGIVNGSPQVTNISVTNRTVVTPNSVVRTEGHLDQTVKEQYIVEPRIWKDLLILRTLPNPKVSPLVCLMNVSDGEIIINPGQVLPPAVEVYGCAAAGAESTSKAQSGSSLGDISPHLGYLFDRSSKSLRAGDVDKLKLLLIEFQDVFAKDEFDLGNFTAIKHSIDTGDNKPVKQRMRRTPVGFEKEEETHLQKM